MTKRIQYGYDAVGNRVGMTDSDGGRFTYAYDVMNRLSAVENPQGERTSFLYDAAGRRTAKQLANGSLNVTHISSTLRCRFYTNGVGSSRDSW